MLRELLYQIRDEPSIRSSLAGDQRLRRQEYHHLLMNGTPATVSFSPGEYFPCGGAPEPSPSPAPANESAYGVPTPTSSSNPLPAYSDLNPPYELVLSRYLSRLHIGNEREDYALESTSPINQPRDFDFFSGSYEGFNNGVYDNGGWSLIDDMNVRNYNNSTGSNLNYMNQRNYRQDVGTEQSRRSEGLNGRSISYHDFDLQTMYLREQGVYFLAKSQRGCRFLQNKLDRRRADDVHLIFKAIINHIVDLTMDPFGNFLVQKWLDVCDEEQRTRIVLMVTRAPEDLLHICLNNYGTHVVQELIRGLSTREQISLLTSALESCFLHLAEDPNGNRVLEHCLQRLGDQNNEFIYNAAAEYYFELATHRHGCCFLQQCLVYSTGKNRVKLAAHICGQGLRLAQHAYGNYVVQRVITLEIPFAAATLASQFEGNYVALSKEKFSSHVIEKCIRHFKEEKLRIIEELVHFPCFEQLLLHEYANYVIKAALHFTKGRLRASLVEVISPHRSLDSNPHCKNIFSILRKWRKEQWRSSGQETAEA